jgi:Tfp pilus assembly protein PilF
MGSIAMAVVLGSCGHRVSDAERRQAENRARLAANMMIQGDLASALREARQGVDLDPGCIDCRITLATIYAARDELPRAEDEFNEVLRREPDNPFALNNLASVYLNMGRPADALPLARRASENEDYVGRHLAFYNVGWALMEQNEYDGALDAMTRALREVPRMCLAHYRIAEIFFRRRNFEDALRHLQQALVIPEAPFQSETQDAPRERTCDQMAETHSLLGSTLVALEREEEAREAFTRCLEIATARTEIGRRCAEHLNSGE